MANKIKQPKKVFKVINTDMRDTMEQALNDGYLIATDLVDALTGTGLLVFVKNE